MTLLAEMIGYAAAVVGTSLMLPQLIKSIRSKKVRDLSYGMLILYFFNCLLWMVYGLLILAWPVVICNAIAFVISIVQLVIKIIYDGN